MMKTIFAAVVLGFAAQAHAILPTYPILECEEMQHRPDNSYVAYVEYAPTDKSHILRIDHSTFAGPRTFKEEANRHEIKQPHAPTLYVGKEYSLTVASAPNPRVGFQASLKHNATGKFRPMKCMIVR